ncbi:MAG TPA: 16S rRNA (adenine(1518)-N(6)/adenine(1519)-N(6))-dimethyltransferase RsmA [Candidatus Paceibacterota bacterium]
MKFIKKKSLGQNFLKNKGILGKIVSAGKIAPGETVLEIGPGEGYLTSELLETGAKVIAIEKDNRLIPILEQKFASEIANGKLILIHDDILDFSPFSYQLLTTNYKLIANIPYYITGEILRKALSEWPQPSTIVLLVQKEVARRIVASPHSAQGSAGQGKESLLSISVKIYGQPKIIDIVKAGSFNPAPKVDSAIIAIENISKNNLSKISEGRFFEILKAGFAHKRKIISANLKPVFGEKTLEKLKSCSIEKDARAENLTLDKWICLSNR